MTFDPGLLTLKEDSVNHPLAFLPSNLRKPLFITFLISTIILSIVMQVMDKPLNLPRGIISFEFASTSQNASRIVNSWTEQARIHAAFSLGIDFLYMPVYSLALGLGILLAAGKHSGKMKFLSALAGWAAAGAPLFDAVENFALWRILTGEAQSAYPGIAAICASIKFGLIILGATYALTAWLLPRRVPA